MTDKTMAYYKIKAREFFDGTINVDMIGLYNEFLPSVSQGGLILDAGCGSGRDSKAFKALGYRVHAFDASQQLAKLAETQINQSVEVTTFQEFKSDHSFDAIWACASLLHVPYKELASTIKNLSASLKDNGTFYCSFKYGYGEVERNGRLFTNLNEQDLQAIITNTPLTITKTWCTGDVREGREDEKWLNATLRKG